MKTLWDRYLCGRIIIALWMTGLSAPGIGQPISGSKAPLPVDAASRKSKTRVLGRRPDAKLTPEARKKITDLRKQAHGEIEDLFNKQHEEESVIKKDAALSADQRIQKTSVIRRSYMDKRKQIRQKAWATRKQILQEENRKWTTNQRESHGVRTSTK